MVDVAHRLLNDDDTLLSISVRVSYSGMVLRKKRFLLLQLSFSVEKIRVA